MTRPRWRGALTDLRDHHSAWPRPRTSAGMGFHSSTLTEQPLMTVSQAVEQLGASPTTIGGLLDKATRLGLVEEITGQRRNRVYRYSPTLTCLPAMSERGGPKR